MDTYAWPIVRTFYAVVTGSKNRYTVRKIFFKKVNKLHHTLTGAWITFFFFFQYKFLECFCEIDYKSVSVLPVSFRKIHIHISLFDLFLTVPPVLRAMPSDLYRNYSLLYKWEADFYRLSSDLV